MSRDTDEGITCVESVVQRALIDGGWYEVALSLGLHVYELWVEATRKPYDGLHVFTKWRRYGEGT